MIVIADIKRGDIGSTAQSYSNAFLGRTLIENIEIPIFDVDFITVNPYMGTDCVKPFIEDCKKYNKGIFVLVKTSNPSSGELQDLKLENGNEVYMQVAELVEKWGEELRGKYGYSDIAAGKSEDIALGFDSNGFGGIVNASRSLMCAYKSDLWKDKYSEEDYAKATRAEALRMKEDLNQVIKNK